MFVLNSIQTLKVSQTDSSNWTNSHWSWTMALNPVVGSMILWFNTINVFLASSTTPSPWKLPLFSSSHTCNSPTFPYPSQQLSSSTLLVSSTNLTSKTHNFHFKVPTFLVSLISNAQCIERDNLSTFSFNFILLCVAPHVVKHEPRPRPIYIKPN